MRTTDTTKIERVIQETKKLVVEKGFHGASIAEIAKKANVSDGYLYRHYQNKRELVKHIFLNLLKEFHDHVFELLEKHNRVRSVFQGIILYLLNLDKNDPQSIRFTYSLIYDADFTYPESRSQAIKKMSRDILELGKRTGEIDNTMKKIDILLTIFTIPVKYTEYVKTDDNYYQENFSSEQEQERLLNLCMNALKPQ